MKIKSSIAAALTVSVWLEHIIIWEEHAVLNLAEFQALGTCQQNL